jgi:Alkylmercury lyase
MSWAPPVRSCRTSRRRIPFTASILPDEPETAACITVKPVSDVSRNAHGEQLPPAVSAALAAAGIPPSKLGAARRARLSDSERELYFWILRRFVTHGRPTSADLAAKVERLGLDFRGASETLAREDLIHLNASGEVAVAYPFSGPATTHQVRFQNGNETYAMCAIDALGIAPMFDESVEIASRDPLTGGSIHVRLASGREGTWEPESAVVVAGVIDRSGDSFRGCCPVLNFFVSAENGERWLEQHQDVHGLVVSMPEAIATGGAVFRDVFPLDQVGRQL